MAVNLMNILIPGLYVRVNDKVEYLEKMEVKNHRRANFTSHRVKM